MVAPINSPFVPRIWRLAHGRTLELGPKGLLMGVLNITPDSFSDGGNYNTPEKAAAQALILCQEGATIIDLGAESTKPNADAVSADEEQERLMPAIASVLAADENIIISVDTYRASTAELALKAGAHIVNDVWGLQREPDIARIAADFGAGLVIMHTNRGREALDDVIEDQKMFFGKSLEIAAKAGVDEAQIMLDPGFGFGKETVEINMALMARFDELLSLGYPWLIGTSRKRFLGGITGREAADRDVATASTTGLLRKSGAAVFRVHNVAVNADALLVCDAMIQAQA